MRLTKAARLLAAGLFCALLAACAAHIERDSDADETDSPERHFLKAVPIPPQPLGRDGLPMARGIAVPAVVHEPLSFGFSDTPPIRNARYEVPVANDDERVREQAQPRSRALPKPESYKLPNPPPAQTATAPDAPDFTASAFSPSFNTVNF